MSSQPIVCSNLGQINYSAETINSLIQAMDGDKNLISDGYHTFGELYEHRFALYLALCTIHQEVYGNVWRSKVQSDGEMYPVWFIVGINYLAGRQITYHLPISWWDQFRFAETLIAAQDVPPFDGHTSKDVIERLKNL